MRLLPASRRRRLAAVTTAVLLCVGAAVSPLAYADDDDDDLRDRQSEVQQQISGANSDLAESSQQLASATAALRSSQAQLAGAQARLTTARAQLGEAQAYDAEMQQRLTVAEAQLDAAEAELVQGQQSVATQRDRVGDQIVAQSMGPGPELEALGAVLGAEDLSDLTRAQNSRQTVLGTEPGPVRWRNEVSSDITVSADRDQLFRVLLNLARNADQALAGDGGGLISVSAWRQRDQIVIEVADTGKGVPAEAQAHLFEAFAGSTRPGGTGLGLPIAREIMRAHGGDIALVHTGDDGTSFQLTLPMR